MEVMNVHLMQYVQMEWVTTHVTAKMDSVVMVSLVLVGEKVGFIFLQILCSKPDPINRMFLLYLDKTYFLHPCANSFLSIPTTHGIQCTNFFTCVP